MTEFQQIELSKLVKRVKVGFVGPINNFYCDPENGVPLIRTTDLEDLDFNKLKYVTKEFHMKNKKSQLQKGDLVIARHGTNGRAMIYAHSRIAQVLNAVIIQPNNKLMSSELLKIFFEAPFVLRQIKGSVKGSVQGVINTKHISDLKLPIGNGIDYNSIERLITALDAKIEVNNKINAELEGMAKLIYDYWFVQFDFPFDFSFDSAQDAAQGKPSANGGLSSEAEIKPYKSSGGKMVYNNELKREIPEGWGVKYLSEVANIKAGGDKPERFSEHKTKEFNVPIFANGSVKDGLYGFTDKARVFERSVTISARGSIGHSVLRTEPFVPIIRLIVVIPQSLKSAKFILEYLKYLVFGKSGSVQQQLTTPAISKFKIICPPDTLIEKYDSIVEPMIQSIEINKKENQKLSELRDWLLPMLMNGQVTVKEAEQYVADTEVRMAAEDDVNYKTR